MKVLLLAPHKYQGSISMDVYKKCVWESLNPTEGMEYSLLPKTTQPFKQNTRFRKALSKYLFYPLQVFLESKKYDLIHILDHSSSYLIPFLSKKAKIVVTVHDLIPLRFPGELHQRQVNRFNKCVNKLSHADRIVSVSSYTKKEIEHFFSIPSENIIVSPLAAKTAKHTIESSEHISNLKKGGADVVILSVGSNLERKNLSILPQVFENLASDLPKIKLGFLRVGQSLPSSLVAQIKKTLGDQLFIEAGRLSEKDLWNVYSECDIVIIPSLYEGFGLPVLEAFSVGANVVCSNSSSLPEVGGSLAQYFHPENPQSAANAIKDAIENLHDNEARNQRRTYANTFSWGRHVEQIVDLHQTLHSRGN